MIQGQMVAITMAVAAIALLLTARFSDKTGWNLTLSHVRTAVGRAAKLVAAGAVLVAWRIRPVRVRTMRTETR